MFHQGQHLLHRIVDENEADEGTEAFLSEACEVLHQVTGFSSHQDKAKEGHP